jgi:ABC transporter substrate binding protein (PQQ-dependent alcohol dehydrogenase system)
VRGLRLLLLLLLLPLAAHPAPVPAQEPAPATFAYLGLADDPRYRPVEIYAGLVLRPEIRPVDGARTAMRDARIVGRALRVAFALEEIAVEDLAGATAAIERLTAGKGVHFVLVDLPAPMVAGLTRATAGRDVLLLNVSAREDVLRGEFCAAHLLHVIPSQAMLADALGQYAAAMQWREILLLVGPSKEDEALGLAFATSVQRFGGEVVETRRFVASNDPRQREQNNIRLLTQGVDYDAVLVADSTADFSRYFPYQTVLPRPVIGSVGLVPSAWHWTFERHGAPQLNQRFARQVEGRRRMADEEFAAWAAVRALVEAYAQTRATDFPTLAKALRSESITFDVYKGLPASFRTWDNQLRQPILLHTADAVIARPPLAEFLHERNVLDTLGTDLPQSACRP